MDSLIAPQNLIKEVKTESIAKSPTFYKPLIFDILTVASAAVFGYFYKRFLGGTSTPLIAGGTLALFGSLSALEILFVRNFGRRFVTILLEVIAILAFFIDLQLRYLLLAGGITLFLLLWGEIASRYEFENGLKIKFFRIVKPSLKKFTTAMLLLLVLLYLPHWDEKNIFLSKENFAAVFAPTANFAHGVYPELDFSSSIGNLAEGVTRLQLQNTTPFKDLPPGSQAGAVKDTVGAVIAKYNQDSDVKITADELTSDVIYDFIVAKLKAWHAQFTDWFLIGWAVLVFFIARSLGVFFYWFASFSAFILYQILLSFDFIHVMGENVTHEVIEF